MKSTYPVGHISKHLVDFPDHASNPINDSNAIGLDTVISEKNKILEAERDLKDFQGLRILGLSKEFILEQNCCGMPKILKALKEVKII